MSKLKLKPPHEVIQERLISNEISQKQLAVAVFGDFSSNSRVKTRNIVNGATERLHPDWVKAICELLGITPNDLYLTKK